MQLAALGTSLLPGLSHHTDIVAAVTPDDPENRPTPAAPYSRHGTPAPLAAAAALTAVQGLVTTLLGIVEVFSVLGGGSAPGWLNSGLLICGDRDQAEELVKSGFV